MWKWWLNNTVKGTQAINNSPYLLKLFSVSVSYQLDLHYSNLFPPLICFENHVNFSFVKLKLLPFVRKFALRSLFFFKKNLCKLPDLLWTFNFNALLKTLPFPGFPKGSIWSTDMPPLTSHTERNSVVFSLDRSVKNQDVTDTCVKTCPNFQTSLWKKVHILHLGVLKSFFFLTAVIYLLQPQLCCEDWRGITRLVAYLSLSQRVSAPDSYSPSCWDTTHKICK